MNRILTATFATIGIMGSTLVGGTAANAAVYPCTYVTAAVTLPAKVVLNQQLFYSGLSIPGTLTTDCDPSNNLTNSLTASLFRTPDNFEWGSALSLTQGESTAMIRPGDITENDTAGTYTANTSYVAETYNSETGGDAPVTFTVSSPTTTIAKYESALNQVKIRRHGKTKKIRFSGTALRSHSGDHVIYSTEDGYRTVVAVQKKVGTTWTTVKQVHTKGNGTFTASVKSKKSGYYRFYIPEGPTVWSVTGGQHWVFKAKHHK